MIPASSRTTSSQPKASSRVLIVSALLEYRLIQPTSGACSKFKPCWARIETSTHLGAQFLDRVNSCAFKPRMKPLVEMVDKLLHTSFTFYQLGMVVSVPVDQVTVAGVCLGSGRHWSLVWHIMYSILIQCPRTVTSGK